MFGWEYPPFQTGGLGTATEALVSGLVAEDAMVTLVVPFQVALADDAAGGFRVVRAAGVRGARKLIVGSPLVPYAPGVGVTPLPGIDEAAYGPALLSQARSAVYGPHLLEEVDRYAQIAATIAGKEEHNLIDAHDWMAFAAGLAAREVSGRPFVAHIHATEYDRAGDGANAAIVERERHGLTSADVVIANSNATRRQVIDRYGVPPERVEVVHLGIDPPARPVAEERAAPFGPGHPLVLFVGRLTWQKGPEYFLEMAHAVSGFAPEARFIMAGGGDLLPGLLDRAAELGLMDKIIFTGGLSHERVASLMRSADVCVMTSVSEPFGLVALESLRAGTPCVVPRSSGVAEVVRNSLAVDFWDIQELTNKVVAVIRSRELHDELSEQGSVEVTAARFSASHMAKRTIAAYHRALSPAPAA